MLEKIKHVFYRPDFFRRQEFTLSQALTFYSFSILVLVIGFSILLIPGAWGVNRYFESAKWQEQKAVIEHLYPDNLVLTLKDGHLLTNQSDPVVIPFPKEWRGKKDEQPTNLIVIDRDVDVSRKTIVEHDTVILANETEIGSYSERKGETQIFTLSKANIDKTIEVTSAKFDYWVEKGASYIQTALLFLMCTLPLLMYVGLWVGYLIYAFFGALFVWWAAHIRNHKLAYSRAYISTLYLLPAPFLLTFFVHVPLLFTLVLFVMALMNFEKHPKEAEATEGSPVSTVVPTTPARPEES